MEDPMRRLFLAATTGVILFAALAGPVGAKTFGAVYVNDEVYRVFGNAANVPDGTGTDPFAKFSNSTNAAQLGVAEFGPGSGDPGDSHGGRWAVYSVTWTAGDPSTLVTSWPQLQSLANAGDLTVTRNPTADFRCPLQGNPQPIG
jgi:hypothetical protein